ncbi:MAG TPA: hypothetical protein VGZ29_09725 [Terriglobia bacterium]|nr:hypothetical protein [Terriglobia bacterium]
MIDPQFTPRPKRKYTVTDRVLAACRANLERANAVPPQIRFRSTEKRRRACHHNLTLALAARKRDRSFNYAPSFRHGWYVPDPERALALVGATPEEYQRHLEAWRREVKERNPEEAKLAHALGMLSWRWIAGVRVQGDLQTLKVYRLLDALAAERNPARAPDAPQPAPPLAAARLTQLGYDLEEALGGWTALEAPLNKIRDRILRIWQELLRLRGEPLMDLPAIACFGRLHEVVMDHKLHSPYELAEPFQSSGATAEALRSKRTPLRAVEHWRKPVSVPAGGELPGQPVPGAGPAAGPAAGLASGEVSRPEEDDFVEGIPAAGCALLRAARRRGGPLPGSFEEFLERVQRALGAVAAGAGARAQRRARRVVLFARALWKRLGALRRRADEVLNWLNRHLGDHGLTLWPEGTLRPELSARLTLHGTLEDLDEPESEAECRGEGLAEFYFQSLAALAREMIDRRQRCRAAMLVVRRE